MKRITDFISKYHFAVVGVIVIVAWMVNFAAILLFDRKPSNSLELSPITVLEERVISLEKEAKINHLEIQILKEKQNRLLNLKSNLKTKK